MTQATSGEGEFRVDEDPSCAGVTCFFASLAMAGRATRSDNRHYGDNVIHLK
jgi:hypothetical protein